MKIQYLKEFYLLSQQLNFTKTAELLFMTQPALSKHLNSLEEELGVQLVKRTKKSVELTEAGETLRELLLPLLNQYDQILSALSKNDQLYKEQLRIGIPAVAVNDYLWKVPSVFQEKYPDLKLSVVAGEPEVNIKRLLNNELDIAMLANIPFPDASQMTFYDYVSEPLTIVCSKDCELARRKRVRLNDLKGYTFLCIDSPYYEVIWEKIRIQCKWLGFSPKIEYYDKLDNILLPARTGKGILAIGAQHKGLASQGLAVVLLDEPSCLLKLSLVYKSTNARPAIQKYIEVFSDFGYFREYPDIHSLD